MKKGGKKKVDYGGTYRIQCNFADEVLVPSEAISRDFFDRAMPWTEDVFLTMDGKRCRPEFVTSWADPKDELMDSVCKSRWGCQFGMVRSLWYDRLGMRYGMRAWHLIRLHELG